MSGDMCGNETELDVGSGRGNCDRAGLGDGAGPSPAKGVALTLSVMSVADEVPDIARVPSTVLVNVRRHVWQ